MGNPELSTDEKMEEMLYDFAFSDDYASREREIFSRLGRKYSAGELVVREGDNSTELYLVVSGSLRIIKGYGTGEEKNIAALLEGEIFGEMSYFDNLPRSASVVAAVDSELLVLGREHFDVIFQMHPRWTTMMLKSLSNKVFLAYLDLKNLCFLEY